MPKHFLLHRMYYTTLGNRLLDKGNHKPGNPKILQCASRSQAASDISILYKLLFEVCHRDFKAHIRKCLFYVRENQPGWFSPQAFKPNNWSNLKYEPLLTITIVAFNRVAAALLSMRWGIQKFCHIRSKAYTLAGIAMHLKIVAARCLLHATR